MGSLSVVLISLSVHVFTCVVGTPVQRLCPVDFYLDQELNACSPCSDLCDMAVLHGTTHICKELCPDYPSIRGIDTHKRGQTTKKQELCPPGTYLDNAILRCESCTHVCDDSAAKGTKQTCKQKCPGFLQQGNSSVPHDGLTVLLWGLVAALTGVFMIGVTVFVVKRTGICSTRPVLTRSPKQRENAHVIVPYIRLDEENRHQRVNQWLTLLHASKPETDSCHGSKSSLIYNPVKTKL